MDATEILTAVLALASIALVGVTGYYAVQTRQMVREMRAARGAQLLPRLVASMRPLGAGNAFLRLTNAGPGPAFNVDVSLRLEPGGLSRRFKAPVVAPGEAHDFIPEPAANSQGLHLDWLTDRYQHIGLEGSFYDALGEKHETSERFDFREYWRILKESKHLVQADWRDEVPSRLEKLEKHVAAIQRSLREGIRLIRQSLVP